MYVKCHNLSFNTARLNVSLIFHYYIFYQDKNVLYSKVKSHRISTRVIDLAMHILYHYDQNVLLSQMLKIIFLYNTSSKYFLLFHFHGIIPRPEYYAPLNLLFPYILQSLTICVVFCNNIHPFNTNPDGS